VLQECPVDSPLFESIKRAKQDLLCFLGKAGRIPFGDLFMTDFSLFLIDDLLNFELEPTFRSPDGLKLWCSTIQIDSIWNQPPILDQLVDKVIAPVEFAAFLLPLSNLLINLVQKRVSQLRDMESGSISYVF
jgi:hypothetical protein